MTDKKKGRASWKPARHFDIRNKDPNYRYRMALNDPGNIEKKQAEGWIVVDRNSNIAGSQSLPNPSTDGQALASPVTYREHVLMVLPNEQAEARDEYFAERASIRERQIKRELESEFSAAAGPGARAPIHGKIVIE